LQRYGSEKTIHCAIWAESALIQGYVIDDTFAELDLFMLFDDGKHLFPSPQRTYPTQGEMGNEAPLLAGEIESDKHRLNPLLESDEPLAIQASPENFGSSEVGKRPKTVGLDREGWVIAQRGS
jgi:hypothetical protein